ncbi:MAG: hypothetical protein FWH18_09135 [Marinilabiliaceae bacterium]|nr:hypothetical protein [Marinilabiliaceae bacterium]
MNKGVIITLVTIFLLLLTPLKINSQEDELLSGCLISFRSPFVVTERSFKALLTGNEVAEFRTTFFSGTVYRIVSCGYESEIVEFSVLDNNRNVLFSSKDHANAEMWDFRMEGSIECIIEAKLIEEKAMSGMVFLLLGFKSNMPDAK